MPDRTVTHTLRGVSRSLTLISSKFSVLQIMLYSPSSRKFSVRPILVNALISSRISVLTPFLGVIKAVSISKNFKNGFSTNSMMPSMKHKNPTSLFQYVAPMVLGMISLHVRISTVITADAQPT